MILGELERNWKNYVWEVKVKGKLLSFVLNDCYRKCEKCLVGKKQTPALKFWLKYDDGSWAHDFDILRCDERGNCYQFTFFTKNINKYKWQKLGRFRKVK